MDDINTLRRILRESRVIAVVGLSADWYRPSYFAAKYMQEHGYRVIPVNPKYPQILGEKCYRSLRDIPEKVDLVDVFRKTVDVMPIAEDAIAIGASVLWQQLGVKNEAAAAVEIDERRQHLVPDRTIDAQRVIGEREQAHHGDLRSLGGKGCARIAVDTPRDEGRDRVIGRERRARDALEQHLHLRVDAHAYFTAASILLRRSTKKGAHFMMRVSWRSISGRIFVR